MFRDNEYARTAVDAANAGAAILNEYVEKSFEVSRKTPRDFVSEVDLLAEDAVIDRIRDDYPDHSVYAEESGGDGESRKRWIIDPLDGTNNYVNGFPQYCVTVALEVDGTLEVGVIADPTADDAYVAVRGEGARRNDQPLSVSDADALKESFLGSGILPPIVPETAYLALLDRLVRGNVQIQGIRCMGTGARDLSRVAEGQFDAFFDKHTSPWDIAAGTLLIEEAGGRVTDFRGDPLDFSKGERELHIVASNGLVHDELLKLYEHASAE